MPIFPTYNQQRNITAGTVAPMRNEAAEEFAPQQQLIKTGLEITKNLSDSHDTIQLTEAKYKNDLALATIKAQAEADPDYRNSQKYIQAVQEATNNSAMGIDNKEKANMFSMEANYDSQVAISNIQAVFTKKELEHGKFVLDNELDLLAQKKLSAKGKQIEVINQQVADLLVKNISAGVITEAEGKKKIEDMEKASVQAVINSDPFLAEKLLTSGEFPSLSPDDRVNFLKIVDSAKAQREAEIKRLNNEKKTAVENELEDKFFKEQLTITDLEKASEIPESQGGADRETLNTMKKKLYSAQKERIENYIGIKYPESEEYVKLVDSMFDAETTDIIKARQILVDAYSDGKIDSNEATALSTIKKMVYSIEANKASNPLVKGYNIIKAMMNGGYVSGKGVEEQAQDLKEYITSLSIQQDAEPETVANGIMERRQTLNYPTFSNWKKGETYNTGIGPVKFIDRDKDGMPIVERINGR